jgi:hypothetical protein
MTLFERIYRTWTKYTSRYHTIGGHTLYRAEPEANYSVQFRLKVAALSVHADMHA